MDFLPIDFDLMQGAAPHSGAADAVDADIPGLHRLKVDGLTAAGGLAVLIHHGKIVVIGAGGRYLNAIVICISGFPVEVHPGDFGFLLQINHDPLVVVIRGGPTGTEAAVHSVFRRIVVSHRTGRHRFAEGQIGV